MSKPPYWNPANPVIPFDPRTSDQYEYWYHDAEGRQFPGNHVSDNLTIVGFERGRTAWRVVLNDNVGHKYYMFGTDLLALLTKGSVEKGVIKHTEFKWVKRGANYGIAPLFE